MNLLDRLNFKRLDHLLMAVVVLYFFMLLFTNILTMYFGDNLFSPATLWFIANGLIIFRVARKHTVFIDYSTRIRFQLVASMIFIASNAAVIYLFDTMPRPTNPLLSYIVMYLTSIVIGFTGMEFFLYLEKKTRPRKPLKVTTKRRKIKPRRIKKTRKMGVER